MVSAFKNWRVFGAKYWTRLSNWLPVLYFSSQTDAYRRCAKNNILKYSNSLSRIYDLTSHGGKKQEKSKCGNFACYNHNIEKTQRSFTNARHFIHILLWFRVLYNTVILVNYFNYKSVYNILITKFEIFKSSKNIFIYRS